MYKLVNNFKLVMVIIRLLTIPLAFDHLLVILVCVSCSFSFFLFFFFFTQGQVFSGADYRVYLLGNPVCAL